MHIAYVLIILKLILKTKMCFHGLNLIASGCDSYSISMFISLKIKPILTIIIIINKLSVSA
jgi:hypothetical protein